MITIELKQNKSFIQEAEDNLLLLWMYFASKIRFFMLLKRLKFGSLKKEIRSLTQDIQELQLLIEDKSIGKEAFSKKTLIRLDTKIQKMLTLIEKIDQKNTDLEELYTLLLKLENEISFLEARIE